MDVNSLSHTRWECKYHILFAPKFRRKVAYGELKQDIANILSMLCKRKGVEIIEAEICPDHVHMLVRIPPSMSVSNFVGYLKGKSTLMIFERHANLKYKYGNRHFWCRGYYVDTVGKNAKKIQEYIQNQLKEDLEYDQTSVSSFSASGSLLSSLSPAAPLSLNVITAARKGSFPVSGNTWIVSLTLISPSCNTRANIPLDGMIHFPIW